MKIAVLDFFMYESHRFFNTKMVQALAAINNSEVLVMAANKNIENIDYKNNVEIMQIKHPNKDKKTLMYKLDLFKSMKRQYNVIKKRNIDVIVINGYSVIHFAFAKYLYNGKSKVFILLHDVDEMKNRKIANLFSSAKLINKYKNAVNFIVLEEFEKMELIENYQVDKKKVHVVRWLPSCKFSGEHIKSKTFVSLSNSADENSINDIIQIEKQTQILEKNKVKLIIKSKEYSFDNGWLNVYNGYLEKSKYNELNFAANAVVTPFNTTFCNRVSGTTIDAFASKKVVLSSNIKLAQFYKKKYPSMISIYKNTEELLSMIANNNVQNIEEQDYNKFLQDYSESEFFKAVQGMVD